MKRSELLNKLGFKEVHTTEVLDALNAKTTKASKEVAEKIVASDYYEIYVSENGFTVNSRYLVTKNEQKQLSNILKKEYIKAGILMDEKGLWIEWAHAENGFVEETELNEHNNKDEYNFYMQRNNSFRLLTRR